MENRLTLNQALERIAPVEQQRLDAVQRRIDSQAKPIGSMGRMEEFARRFVAMSGRESIRRKVVFTFAGDHGVTEEGVSAFPKEVTPQMVYNFVDKGACVNALASHVGAEVIVVDMGVDHDFGELPGVLDCKVARGTANFTKGPAMSRQQAIQALEEGINLAARFKSAGVDLVATGDMGIGNTTPSSTIVAAICALSPETVTHRGTGIDDEGLCRKLSAIRMALDCNRPDPLDPLDVLAKVGGFEIAGVAGLVLGCAAVKLPVVVDGFISTAGALIAHELHPHARDYMFAAHQSVEIGHRHMLERIGHIPMLDLQMRLGEGTGSALGMGLIEASLRLLREVRTFDDSGVTEGADR